MIRSSMVRPMMYYVVWRGPVAAVGAEAVQRFNATPTRDGQAMRWTATVASTPPRGSKV